MHKKTNTTALAEHHFKTGHIFRFDETKSLDKEDNCFSSELSNIILTAKTRITLKSCDRLIDTIRSRRRVTNSSRLSIPHHSFNLAGAGSSSPDPRKNTGFTD
ncbi:hypothetical protein M0804_013524 [Polistes exclamans]|nr:hypothetical protein M0804_013524 [Polistes exclamans]